MPAAGCGSSSPPSATTSPPQTAAQKACARFQPGPQNNHGDRHAPSKPALLAFARCLRAHGMSGFPDPNPQGEVTSEMLKASGIDVRGPAFITAAKRCVSVTHGQITMAEVAAAANHLH